MTRRNVLSTTAAAGTTLFSGVLTDKKSRYTGFTYNTSNHQIRGQPTASFAGNKEEISGTLHVGDYHIPINKNRPDSSRKGPEGRVNHFTVKKRDNNKPDLRTKIVLEEGVDTISGYITRESPVYGRLGFVLTPQSNKGVEWRKSNLWIQITT